MLSKLIYSSRLALAATLPGEIKIKAPSTDKDASVLVHPGALAYLVSNPEQMAPMIGASAAISGAMAAAMRFVFQQGVRGQQAG